MGKYPRTTLESFIEKSKLVHGNTYDYSKVKYKTCITKVKIKCNICNVYFHQLPTTHIKGSGCRKHNQSVKPKTTELFIKEAQNVHGNRYDYSLVEYKNRLEPIIIICKKHGKFTQSPRGHIEGGNCRSCIIRNTPGMYTLSNAEKRKESFFNIDSELYCVKLMDEREQFYKIGISKNSFIKRAAQFPYSYEIIDIFRCDLYSSILLEKSVLSKYKEFKYEPLKKFGGHTECFSINPIDFVREVVGEGHSIIYD